MTDQEQIAKYQLALCLAEGLCPECKGEGHVFSKKYLVATPSEGEEHKPCPTCVQENHTARFTTIGNVPLLEGVREKCPLCEGTGIDNHPHPPFPSLKAGPCKKCQGRGWVPAYRTPADVWKWFEVIPTNAEVKLPSSLNSWAARQRVVDCIYEAISKGPLAFFQALAKSLGVKE